MVSDNASELRSAKWKEILNEFGVRERSIESYSPHSNYAENTVKLVKFSTVKLMEGRGIPIELWDYVVVYASMLNNVKFHPVHRLEGRTPFEYVHGRTPDISAFIDFGMYDFVWFIVSPKPKFPEPRRVIGRFMGPSKTLIQDLSFKILTKSGRIIVTSSVLPLTELDLENPTVIDMKKDFSEAISKHFTSRVEVSRMLEVASEETLQPAVISQIRIGSISSVSAEADAPKTFESGWENARVTIDRGDGKRQGIVRNKKRDSDGEIIGSYDSNPILDTTVYHVDFDDGISEEIAANVIVENLYQQYDPDGRRFLELDEIIDHYQSKALSPSSPRMKSTSGSFLLVRWKDGSVDMVQLRDIKESYPKEVAEYAVKHNLVELPAYKWWVPYTLRRAKRIISKIRSRNIRMEKFGIRIPRNVEEAYRLDQESNTNYWALAIEKEMRNVNIAFNILGPGAKVPVGYQKISCHLVFDIKIDGTRKARFVAGGHLTETPSTITYSSVVSRDSIRILLVIAALNGLELSACDIVNAYLTSLPREKVFFIAGKEFREQEGRVVVVVRALYGLKSSGAAFRNKL